MSWMRRYRKYPFDTHCQVCGDEYGGTASHTNIFVNHDSQPGRIWVVKVCEPCAVKYGREDPAFMQSIKDKIKMGEIV